MWPFKRNNVASKTLNTGEKSMSMSSSSMEQAMQDREMRRMVEEYRRHSQDALAGQKLPSPFDSMVNQAKQQTPPKPLPPAVKAKSDAIMKQREELKQKFKEQDQQLMEQRALVECGIEVGSTLVGQDGEEATVVWIQPRSDGYNVVLRVTTAKTIAPTQIGDYWTVAETPKEKSE